MVRMILLLSMFAIVGCGVFHRHKAEGGTENTLDASVRLEVAFPTCATIEDDWALVECIEAATRVVLIVKGTLSTEQLDILEEFEIDLPEEINQ